MNINRIYILKTLTTSVWRNSLLKIAEGRLPSNKNEIAISEEIKNNAKVDYKIGDQLTFDIGERLNKT